MPSGNPVSQVLEANFAPQGTAATTGSTVVGEVNVNGTVTGVSLTPNATITGAATNNRVFTLVNKGQAGAGTAAVAAVTFASGTNAAVADEFAVTVTPSNATVVEGDTLALDETVNGTGMTHGGGHVKVEVTRSS